MTKNFVDDTISRFLKCHPCVFEKKRGGSNQPPLFSVDKFFKDIKPLDKPLREIRTGNVFVPRKCRISKERQISKIVKRIEKDNKGKNMVLYHGTKFDRLPNILKKGIIPQKSQDGTVSYFTPHKWRAKYYATKGQTYKKEIGVTPHKGVILKVDVPDALLQHYDKSKIENLRKVGYPYKDIKVYKKVEPKNIISVEVHSKNKKCRK